MTDRRTPSRRRRRAAVAAAAALTLLPALPSSASALRVEREAARVVDPTSYDCAGSVVETVRAPVGAQDVRPLTPLGTQVIDVDLGYPAATLTAADPAEPGARGEPGIAFTFSGVPGSECELYDEGWSGEDVRLRIVYALDEQVWFKEVVGRGNDWMRQRPRRIKLGSDIGYDGIRWTSWGDEVATGRGVYYYVEKGYGFHRRITWPMLFRLSEPTRCNGRLRYLRLETVRTEMRRTKPFKLPRRSDRQLSCTNGIYG